MAHKSILLDWKDSAEEQPNSWTKNKWCERCDELQKHYKDYCIVCNRTYEIECQQCHKKTPARAQFIAFKYCGECLRERQQTHRRMLYLTLKGQAQFMYARIRSRCLGKVKNAYTRKYYKGMPFMKREDFYKLVFADKNLLQMAEAFLASGKDFRLAPSVNRINPDLGYIEGNIEFITVSQNSKLARRSRFRSPGGIGRRATLRG